MKALNVLAATTILGSALTFVSSTSAQDAVRPERTPPTVSDTRANDEAFNYGWLGLAGLLGLLGLMPRNRGVGGVTVRDGAGNVKNTVRP
jgi:hypothetical protein